MHPSSSPDSVICFGIFELNLEARELRKRGLQVKLAQQAFHLLDALVQKAGEVLTRDELRKKLWPANTYVDFEHGLNKAIHSLREALGDSAINPRFIETVPGQGYRFVPVVQKRGEIPVGKKKLESIAVVPFAFASSQHEESSFIAGQLTATVIDILSRESKVRVLAYNTVRHYKSEGKAPATIAAELGVKGVLVGEILQRNGDALIHVELIDASDGAQICGMQLKRSWTEFADETEKVAIELSNRIVQLLEGRTESARPRKHSSIGNGPPMLIGVRALSKAWAF